MNYCARKIAICSDNLMYGITSLLDEKHSDQVISIWEHLKSECGLTGVWNTDIPHFSWQVAEEYKWPATEEGFKEIALKLKTFTVQATGIGIFTGAEGVLPVIYIPVIRTPILNAIHQHIWEKTETLVVNANKHYLAQSWIPHITLAYKDLNPEKLNCAMKYLSFKSIDWTLTIDNITILKAIEGQKGELIQRVDFQA